MLVWHTEPDALPEDIGLGHVDERRKKCDLCRVFRPEIDHLLERLDELRATVGIPAVVERLEADEDRIRLLCLCKTGGNREEVRIPEGDIRVGHMHPFRIELFNGDLLIGKAACPELCKIIQADLYERLRVEELCDLLRTGQFLPLRPLPVVQVEGEDVVSFALCNICERGRVHPARQ